MTFTSIACPNCITPQMREAMARNHGIYNPRSIWEDEYDGTCKCTNCGFARPYHKRKRGKTRQWPNKSQLRAFEFIHHYFSGARYTHDGLPDKDLHEFTITPTDYDNSYWVSVHTDDSPLLDRGAHVHVGPRGAIGVGSAYGINGDSAHIARMLRGKVL